MNIIGIVCEYNPFHKGHAWQIQAGRAALGEDSAVVCVMSGDYVQRGEAAVFSKFARAEAACRCGADLVFELPLPWALSSAEGFARGAVAMLAALGCTHLSFGSEYGAVDKLELLASQLVETNIIEEIKAKLAQQPRASFASARQEVLAERLGDTAALLEKPNNILAVEYLYLEHAASDRSASLLAAALSLLLAAVLTAVAALVIRWYRKRRRTGGPRLRWSPRNFQRGNLLPVLSLGLMAGYWALSGTFLLPPLFYRWQAPLFHLLTAALALLCGVMLRRRRGVLALSLGALAAGWLALSNLQIFQRAYFVRAGEVMRTTRFTANALPVGEVIPAAYLLAAIRAPLCLLLPLIGPEGAPRQGGGAP